MEPSGLGRGAAQTLLEGVRPGTVNIQVIVYGEGLPYYFIIFLFTPGTGRFGSPSHLFCVSFRSAPAEFAVLKPSIQAG